MKFILNTVIQFFRCVTVAVSLEAVFENFSKLFCWESINSLDHQNTASCGVSGCYGKKSLRELSHFSLSVPSTQAMQNTWFRDSLVDVIFLGVVVVLGGVVFAYSMVMVQLFSSCYQYVLRVKIVPEEKGDAEMCHLTTPHGTVSTKSGCMFWCFPAFLVNLHGTNFLQQK